MIFHLTPSIMYKTNKTLSPDYGTSTMKIAFSLTAASLAVMFPIPFLLWFFLMNWYNNNVYNIKCNNINSIGVIMYISV